MKVLQVSTIGFADPRYYRSNELTLCRSLAKLHHEVSLYSSDRHPKWQAVTQRHVQQKVEELHGFTIRRFASGPEFGTVPIMPFLLRQILDSEWDILHAHTILAPASFYSALASRIKRRPLVVTQHDYVFGAVHGPKRFLHLMNNTTLGRFTMHTASAVIGLSSEAIKFAQQFGADQSKTLVIPNSVDTTTFRPDQSNLLEERWGIVHPVVLFIGRLVTDKSPHVVLEAFRKAVKTVPNASLVIIGKGPEEARLKSMTRQLGLERVFFLGRIPREEMPSIYAGGDLLVLPSLYEPFGNVVLEAMATGLPVIGSKVGGMIDTITQAETGFHIRPGHADELAEYMTRILADNELRSRMSRAARQKAVERYDDITVARAVEKVYYDCLSG